MSLFGGAAGAGAAGGGGPSYLHSFKAGRCDFNQDSKTVTPTAAKGLLFIQKAPDIPGMMQIGWRNRDTGEIEDNHLTCNDATFVRCKSAGNERRVFYLKFENNRRSFYWMQDLDDSDDVQNATKLNDLIAGKVPDAGGPAAMDLGSVGLAEDDLKAINALPEAERNEILATLGLLPPMVGAGAMTPAAQPPSTTPPPVVRNSDPDASGDSPAPEVPPVALDDDQGDDEVGEDAMDAD